LLEVRVEMTEEKAPPKPHEKFFYFVDDKKYESNSSSVTGAEIKAKIPNFDRSYALYVEGEGSDPDRQVADTDAFDLEHHKAPYRFYTVPPATFGYA
jgi:hypothetical protein